MDDKSKQISVLMPTLNVRPYIEECMDSVVNQTYSELEILVIDAGSTDGTLEVLEKYAQNDRRIRILHSPKKSYGYQMNQGLEQAGGEYVAIVETDDYIAEDMMESLLAVAEQTNADYVKGFPQLFTPDETGKYVISDTERYMYEKDYAGRKLDISQMPEVLVHDIYHWNGLYRRDFLKDIRFNETPGAAFQDQGFLLRTLSSAKCAVYIEKPIYYYRQMNPNSSIYNSKGFQYIYNEYQMNYEYAKALGRPWLSAFFERIMNQIYGRYTVMTWSGRFWEEALDDIDKLRCWIFDVVQDGYLTREVMGPERRKRLLLFLEGPRLLYEYIKEPGVFDRKRAIQKITDCKYIWIYGAGKIGGKAMKQLMQTKVRDKICGFVVSEKAEEAEIDGYPVKGLGEIDTVSAGTLFVIALSWKYREEVLTLLDKQGIDDYVIWDEEFFNSEVFA